MLKHFYDPSKKFLLISNASNILFHILNGMFYLTLIVIEPDCVISIDLWYPQNYKFRGAVVVVRGRININLRSLNKYQFSN